MTAQLTFLQDYVKQNLKFLQEEHIKIFSDYWLWDSKHPQNIGDPAYSWDINHHKSFTLNYSHFVAKDKKVLPTASLSKMSSQISSSHNSKEKQFLFLLLSHWAYYSHLGLLRIQSEISKTPVTPLLALPWGDNVCLSIGALSWGYCASQQ